MPDYPSRMDDTQGIIRGWVELDGRRLSHAEIQEIIQSHPSEIARFGGEFFLNNGRCQARDSYGIIPGPLPKGTLICGETLRLTVDPAPASCTLEEAILTAVRLRSDKGVCALSGGLDSSLVASIARLPCVSVGTAGSHDLKQAKRAAASMNLSCELVTLTPGQIEEALCAVLAIIPERTPVHAAIATTLYCVAGWAADHGYCRILTGQGADELFGGYSRYLDSTDPGADMARDIRALDQQIERDQAVAGMYDVWFSYPYLDARVVRAAGVIPVESKILGGVRKWPLIMVAERYIPTEIAWYEKKAMQYGSGVWKTIRDLARHNGYKTSVQGYLNQVSEREHGNREGC